MYTLWLGLDYDSRGMSSAGLKIHLHFSMRLMTENSSAKSHKALAKKSQRKRTFKMFFFVKAECKNEDVFNLYPTRNFMTRNLHEYRILKIQFADAAHSIKTFLHIFYVS